MKYEIWSWLHTYGTAVSSFADLLLTFKMSDEAWEGSEQQKQQSTATKHLIKMSCKCEFMLVTNAESAQNNSKLHYSFGCWRRDAQLLIGWCYAEPWYHIWDIMSLNTQTWGDNFYITWGPVVILGPCEYSCFPKGKAFLCNLIPLNHDKRVASTYFSFWSLKISHYV